MAGPWTKYAQGGVAPAMPTTGDPMIAPPNPYKANAEVRAVEDQAMDRERLRLAQEASERATAAEARAAQTASQGTESERTAGFLAGRLNDAVQRLTTATSADPDAARPTLGVEAVRGVFGDTAANYLTDSDRQTVRAAQIDIIDAALTLGTGAAYTREQLEGYREAYFPKLGDSDSAVQSKRDALRSLLVNAQTKAGRAAPDIERALAALDGTNTPPPPPPPATGEQRDDEPQDNWPGIIGQDGKPLPPGGGYGFDPTTGEWSLYGTTTDDRPGQTGAEREAAELNQIQGELGATDLAGQGLMLGLGDEAAGVGTAIGQALTGNFDVAGNYQLGRDAQQIRLDQARDRLGAAGTAAEIVGGGALGRVGGGFNSLMQGGRAVAASGAPVTRAAIQGQVARQTAREGALAGGVGGFGYGEGLEGSTSNALLGAATGGALGYGGQRIGNALANRRPAAATVSGAQVQQAADDLDIPVIPAVTGGTTARRLTSGARQGFISDRPISRAVDAMETAGEAARDRTASQAGRVLDNEDAGNVVRQAANVYSRRTSQIGGNLYERADRKAGGLKLTLPKAVTKADEWLGRVGQSIDGEDAQLWRDVANLREKMAAGRFSVEGIRQTRTALREQLQERGLRGSATDKVLGEILEAATDDLFDGLTSAGKPEAASALRTANAFWKKRVETIDEVLEPILGKNAPRSGEQIVTALEALAKPKTGNASRLRQLFDAMPGNEAKSVAATIISRLGQPTPGAAQTGGGFSFNTFLTNWNNISPRARAAMFPPETRGALDKLATVSTGVKQAGSAMNTSNTAGALGVQAVISTPLIWLAEPMTLIGATAGQWAVGRLLASPRFARWIAGAPKSASAQAQRAYIAKLGGIARAEPAIANEVGLFQRAANDNLANVSRTAAEPEQGEPRNDVQRP